jgi:hypothetical protein
MHPRSLDRGKAAHMLEELRKYFEFHSTTKTLKYK